MPGPVNTEPVPTEPTTRIEDLPKPNLYFRELQLSTVTLPAVSPQFPPRRQRPAARSTTSETCSRGGPVTWSCSTPQHYRTRVASTSTPRGPTWPIPAATTRDGSSDTAVRLVVEDGLPYRTASWSLWRDHREFVPYCHDPALGRGRGKAARRNWTEHLDWTLSDCSGFIAADEL